MADALAVYELKPIHHHPKVSSHKVVSEWPSLLNHDLIEIRTTNVLHYKCNLIALLAANNLWDVIV